METNNPQKAVTIAVGSTNPAKVEAARWAVDRAWPGARIHSLAVESGVGEMPRSDAEGRQGALQRARAAREQADADYGVGMEGAVHEEEGCLYVVNWAAVAHRDGRYGLACGGRFPLPDAIAHEIRQGGELGPIIDRYTNQENTKHNEGAAGFLTQGLVPRVLPFRIAVGLALAPFLRPELYERGDEACATW
jgi:inosine/xanthosine triphosphatase